MCAMTNGWHWHCKVCHAPLVLRTDGWVACTCLSSGSESETIPPAWWLNVEELREAARKRGVQLGRRPRVFRRDEVQRLRSEGKSWSAISKALGVPVSTARGAVESIEVAQ